MSRTAAPRRDGKSGTWGFVVDLPPGPDGNRRQARRRGFPTKKAAQEALDKLRVGSREGTFVELSRLTVAAYLDGWLDTIAVAGRTASTVANYRRMLASYVRPVIGGVQLQQLTGLHLDHLYRTMRDRGLGPRTTRYVHAIVRKALHDARRKGLVVRNVADDADPLSAKAAKAPEMRWWTPAELSNFLAATADDPLGPLFRLGGMTGMRRGELCGLPWADVDFEAGLVHVRRQLTTIEHEPVFVDHPKSDHGRRTIDLDAETVRILRAHRAQQVARRLQLGEGWVDGDLVFPQVGGRHYHPESVSRAFVRAASRHGLPTIRFHDLRHTHCAHLIAANVNPKAVSRRMGHHSVAFTLDRYAHLMPEAGSEAAAAVAALVDG